MKKPLSLLLPLFVFLCIVGISLGNNPNLSEPKVDIAQEGFFFRDGIVKLAGTLYRPVLKGDYPGVVILGGSDRSRRGGLKIKIAEYFASQNIAALVYDSPGTGGSSGDAMVQTRSDRVKEVLKAVDFLRNHSGVKKNSIGIFGGSEGADIALMASAVSSRVSFVIPVSGPMGVPVLDILRYSAEKKGYKQGLNHTNILKAITFKEISFAFLGGIDFVEWTLIQSRIKSWKDDTWLKYIKIAGSEWRKMDNGCRDELFNSFKQIISRFRDQRWFSLVNDGNVIDRLVSLGTERFFKILDSGRFSADWDRNFEFVSNVQCPVLAVWGEEDSFLPPRQSAARLKKGLSDAGHKDFQIKIFPGASHFLTVKGILSDFVPGYLDLMTTWVNKRF